MIIIYTVFADKKEAQKITRLLLEKKMVVCGNMFAVDSMYLEEESVKEAEEVVVIYKTLKQNYKRVKKEIEKNHSYKTPFIGSVKINEVNKPYYHYLKKEVAKFYGKKSPEAKPNLKNPIVRE